MNRNEVLLLLLVASSRSKGLDNAFQLISNQFSKEKTIYDDKRSLEWFYNGLIVD